MTIDIFKTILREFYEEPLVEGLVSRDIDIPLDTNMVLSVIGCRRAGKTTLLKQLVHRLVEEGVDKRRIVFVNFEDERIDRRKESFDELLLAHAELYPDIDAGDCWYFFDEVQEMPDWEKFVRRLHEHKSKHVVVTGSNARFLSREIASSLRGRTISYEVFPFSFREYVQYAGFDPSKQHTTKDKAMLRKLFDSFLHQGGFPETINQVPSVRNKILRSYLDVMMYRDLIERYAVRNHEALKAFIVKRLANIGKEFSVHKTYLELKSAGFEVSKDFLYAANDWCEEIYLLFSLRQYHESTVKQQTRIRKNYAIDNGLVGNTSFRASEDIGRFLENAVFLDLRRNGKEVFFLKEGKECDFIVRINGKVELAIQVCKSIMDSGTRIREIEGLIQGVKRTGAAKAVIITLDEEDIFEEQGVVVHVQPALKWFLQKEK